MPTPNDIISVPRRHWEIIAENTACPIAWWVCLGEYEDNADSCFEDECGIAKTCKWLREFLPKDFFERR